MLEHKPGALAGSTPLARWRQSGRWPASFDRLWQALIARQGQSGGTRAMVRLLQLGRTHGQDRLRAAVESALTLGCTDPAAVEHLVTAPALVHTPAAPLVVEGLAAFERPLPVVSNYDHLLAPEPVSVAVAGGVGE